MSLRKKAQELRRRISQSMSDAGPGGTTKKCKSLQRSLAKVQRKRRNKSRQR